jgi:hypothetical protein
MSPSRHEVQYYSESQGKFVPIEDMPISHIRNAMNKLHAKITASGRPAPVTEKQLEALKNETTFRAGQAGELTVPGETKAATAAFEEQIAAKAAASGATAAEQAALRSGLRQLGPGMLGIIISALPGQAINPEDMQDQTLQRMEAARPGAMRQPAPSLPS